MSDYLNSDASPEFRHEMVNSNSSSKLSSPKCSPRLSTSIILGIITTMLGSALPAGHNLGVINTPQKPIRSWIASCLAEEYGVVLNISQEYIIWGLVVSIFVGGALIGSTSGAHLANTLGRRNGLFTVHLVCLLSGIIIIGCKFISIVELLLVGRLTAGLAAGAATSLVPLYLSEISPPALRGVMGTLFPLGLCTGILISQILGIPSLLGTESLWPYLVGGHVLYVVLALLLHKFTPLSPTHLYLNKNDAKKGRKVLYDLRRGDVYTISQEENALLTVYEEKETKNTHGGLWKLFKDRRFFRSMTCVIILNAGQQLVGINAVFFYSTLVFLNSGMALGQSQAASLCAGVANLLMAALALPLVRYIRRKCLLIISLTLYCFWQIVLMLSLYYVNLYPWMSKLAFVSIFASVLTYGIGLGPVPYMIGTEIFSSDVRGLGLAIGSMSNWGANLVVGLVFPILQEKLGVLSFSIFIGVCILLLLFVCFGVPETFRKPKESKIYSDFEKTPSSILSLNSEEITNPEAPLNVA